MSTTDFAERTAKVVARKAKLEGKVELALTESEALTARRDEWTDGERERAERLVTQIEGHVTELDSLRAEHVELLREAVSRGTFERGDGFAAAQRDRFEGPNGEIRDRALRLIDRSDISDDGKEQTSHVVRAQDISAEVSEYLLAVADPAYERAFAKMAARPHDPMSARMSLDADEQRAFSDAMSTRAAMSLTGANGGYLVPFTLDPTINLTNDGAVNPIREIARVVTITTDDWNGINSAGVTAEWLAEATEAADASPTFTQPSITPAKGSAYVQASIEVAMDSNIGSQIGPLLTDAKNRLEATAFWTGTGNGQPQGIVTALGLTTASRVAGSSGAAGAADLVSADVYAVDNALPDRHTPGAQWTANKAIFNKIRQLATNTANPGAFWADLGGGTPPNLIGYPIHKVTAMDSTIVSGSNDDVLILGDFRNGYVVVDRIGMAIAFNPLVVGANRRPTGEVGWFAYWRTGGESINDNAFRMLRL